MSNPPPASPPARMQFTLREWLAFVAWLAVGHFFIFWHCGGFRVFLYKQTLRAWAAVDWDAFIENARYYVVGALVVFVLIAAVVRVLTVKNWIVRPFLATALPFLLYWGFDASQPRSIITDGGNPAIDACKTFATAEDTYRRVDYDGNGVLEYSPTLAGLYSKGQINLVDKKFAAAEGPNGAPKWGYLYKVLTCQGPQAPGGSKSYFSNGKMTVGYALLAWPAFWDDSGRNTFQISSSGTVYQKDLGPDTERLVSEINAFDPTNWVTSE